MGMSICIFILLDNQKQQEKTTMMKTISKQLSLFTNRPISNCPIRTNNRAWAIFILISPSRTDNWLIWFTHCRPTVNSCYAWVQYGRAVNESITTMMIMSSHILHALLNYVGP